MIALTKSTRELRSTGYTELAEAFPPIPGACLTACLLTGCLSVDPIFYLAHVQPEHIAE